MSNGILAICGGCNRWIFVNGGCDFCSTRKKASWWTNAQSYEGAHAANYVREYGEEIRCRPGSLPPEFFPTEDIMREITEWATGRICLEVGPCVCPSITGLSAARQIVVVEPLADQFRDYIWMPPHGILVSKPGEDALPEYEGKVDGIIVDRNCIDHANNPLELFACILACAAPDCWLLHWSDIWHIGGADSGHRDISRTPDLVRDMVVSHGFEIPYQFTQRKPEEGLIDWGCLARKK